MLVSVLPFGIVPNLKGGFRCWGFCNWENIYWYYISRFVPQSHIPRNLILLQTLLYICTRRWTIILWSYTCSNSDMQVLISFQFYPVFSLFLFEVVNLHIDRRRICFGYKYKKRKFVLCWISISAKGSWTYSISLGVFLFNCTSTFWNSSYNIACCPLWWGDWTPFHTARSCRK